MGKDFVRSLDPMETATIGEDPRKKPLLNDFSLRSRVLMHGSFFTSAKLLSTPIVNLRLLQV